jgi:methylthioribose-1-phosphate isomerase
MVGYVMQQGQVNKVIVGADRIFRTGHVVNKIGTYTVSLAAKKHSVPFYVAAPLSTFDFMGSVESVVLERRREEEVLFLEGRRIAPRGVSALNPAFDITPPENVSGIVTEKGVLWPPYEESLQTVTGSDR